SLSILFNLQYDYNVVEIRPLFTSMLREWDHLTLMNVLKDIPELERLYPTGNTFKIRNYTVRISYQSHLCAKLRYST
ncbi:hypothetical protein L9F63_016895, partial [Diploptera punctata]